MLNHYSIFHSQIRADHASIGRIPPLIFDDENPSFGRRSFIQKLAARTDVREVPVGIDLTVTVPEVYVLHFIDPHII
jgi:hypothetical protein